METQLLNIVADAMFSNLDLTQNQQFFLGSLNALAIMGHLTGEDLLFWLGHS